MKRPSSLVLTITVLLLSACNQGGPEDKAKITQLESEVSTLKGRVDQLETKAAQPQGPQQQWILWVRSRTLAYHGPGFLTGEAPPQQLGAFATKAQCEEKGQMDAAEHGALGVSHYILESAQSKVEFTNLCFPEDVDLRNKQG